MIKSEEEYRDTLQQFNEVMKLATQPNVHFALDKDVKAEILSVAMDLSEYEVDHNLVTLPTDEERSAFLHNVIEGSPRIEMSEEWARKMAELEDGHEIGVGGLLVDLGLYKEKKEQDEGRNI